MTVGKLADAVLHVSKTSNGGRFIGFQLPHLVSAGIDIHLAVPGDGVLSDMAREAGATVHYIPEMESSHPIAGWKSLGSIVSDIRPKLVHTHFVKSTLAVRASRELSTSHRFVNLFQVPGPLHLERLWSRQLDVKTAGAQDVWAGACEFSVNAYLESGVSNDRVFLAYYGKDLSAYKYPDRRQLAALREELGIADDQVVATMVSHVYPRRPFSTRGIKGHEDFIEAIRVAREVDPLVRGLIVGGPRPGAEKYYNWLRARAEAIVGDSIIFTGQRDDVPALYGISDVAVHPSLSENIGGAGESLLMGVPTVSTNIGGFPDVVKHRLTGQLVDTRSPRQIAKAILRVRRSPQVSMVEANRGRDIMTNIGSAALNAKRVLEIYRECGVAW